MASSVKCAAFRLSDMVPCQCKPKNGSDLCKNHQDFYDKEAWKERFFDRSKYYIGTLHATEDTFTTRLIRVIEHSLISGRVVLDKRDIDALSENSLNLFTVMVGTGKVDPNWNIQLQTNALKHAMKALHPLVQVDIPLPIIEKEIVPYMNAAKNPITVIVKCILLYNMVLRNANQEIRERYVKSFIEKMLDQPVMKDHLMTGSEYILNLQKINADVWKNCVNESGLLKVLEEKQKTIKAEKRALMMVHKGGIVEKVFHPDKVERWLELGGEELVDMMFG